MTLQFEANFMSCDADPATWAREREAEGWDVLGCADHLWSGVRPFPHVWVSLTALACATTRPLLTTSFANNLLRSPVEFAQASLQLQRVSGGRFEAGLGAGWSSDEIEGIGAVYPTAGVRATRFREAISITRALFTTGECSFHSDQYDIEVPKLGPQLAVPPPLVASLGGDRTIREIAPLVDRVELKPITSATASGALDVSKLGSIPRAHLEAQIAKVRAVAPDVPLAVFILCGVGSDERTQMVADLLEGTWFGGFFGEAGKVAESMLTLEEIGISRVQVSPFGDASFAPLAAALRLGLGLAPR